MQRVAIFFLLVAAIRCIALLQVADGQLEWRDSLQVDNDSYLRLAINLAEAGVYGFEDTSGSVTATAFRPPLYPWVLSFGVRDRSVTSLWIGMLHIGLGMWTACMAYLIARQLQIRWLWLAPLLIAIDPVLLRASQAVMTETLAAALSMTTWWLWLKIQPVSDESAPETWPRYAWLVAFGGILGASILARPTFAPWTLLSVIGIAFFGCKCWKRRLTNGLVVALVAGAFVVPWTLRNWQLLGKPVWATTHGGYTLYLANNPFLYDHFRESGPNRDWDATEFHAEQAELNEKFRLGTEIGNDDALSQKALKTIRSEPAMFATSCIYRLGWFWAAWPNLPSHSAASMAAKWAIGAWYVGWFGLAIAGLIQVRSTLRLWLPAFTLAITLSAIHSVYWSNMRMRSPVAPMVYVVALAAFGRGRDRS
ncbi:MAG TPA: hypothetical protein DDW52_04775 [Planctomycetaceae bacterium]|nr:hypothetical protein [Planctomycetaceae bacterium]